MNLKSDVTLHTVRSPLKEYSGEYFTHADEQENLKDTLDVWNEGLTTNITHWKIDEALSKRHPVFSEWSLAIYNDPFQFKGRIDTAVSEDLMKVIGTARNFDAILTVHKAAFDSRNLKDSDMFSYKGTWFGISSITTGSLFKEYDTMLIIMLFKRNTPELAPGVNQPIIDPTF